MRRKVTVVGGGSVGASCAQRIAERDYVDLVVIDTDGERDVVVIAVDSGDDNSRVKLAESARAVEELVQTRGRA